MRNFLSAEDVPNINELVQKAIGFKADPTGSKLSGTGKRMGLLFLNPSMRTRLSTQIAASNLGMESIVFNVGQDGWSLEFEDEAIMNGTTVEHVKEAAPILGKYFDVLGVRTFPGLKDKAEDYSEFFIKQFVKYSGIPVVSLESASLHPLQSLTDIITITENFKEKRKPKVVLTWAPHVKALPQCVANSFAQWINAWGEADFVIAHPEGYELDKKFTGNAAIAYDQSYALKEADFVYVKNWSSYSDYGNVLSTDANWMLTNEKLFATNNAKVMHCLPVRRNVELSGEVLDGANSIVTQQAGNRVWAAQAVLSEILNG
ncbi:MAG: acetylornithine carbamoyltransferase [Cyclobacteriaceae bacterium]|nr:acetylornithine carbamoyltransferase [Cyclobacteriaceae bacterium]